MAGKVLIALLEEGHENGEISDETHETIGEVLAHLERSEYHQERTQSKHEGKNATTDKQLAICRVALPALASATAAYNQDDFIGVVRYLKVAIETDGTRPKKSRRKK
jgi:hypothetical protein